MKLFYGQIFSTPALHPEEEQHIIKVLRMKEGDTLHLTDGQGNLAKATLSIQGKRASLHSVEIIPTPPSALSAIHIAIAPTKNIDRTEFFVEKAIEMGVSEISFILTEHSERKNINIEKIQKQAIAASKQCLRLHFPQIHSLTKLQDFVALHSSENIFVAHCDPHFERTSLSAIRFEGAPVFLIGPEGDFSPKEIAFLQSKGIKAISLGERRLRTETAGIFVAAWNYARSF